MRRMTVQRGATAAVCAAVLLVLAGCSTAGGGDAAPKPTPTTPSVVKEAEAALAFLAEQEKPVEVVCTPTRVEGGLQEYSGEVAFYSFEGADQSWRDHIVLIKDMQPGADPVVMCIANLPANVDTELGAISDFLNAYNLEGSYDSAFETDNVEIEVTQNKDMPAGTYGAALSLTPLAGAVNEDWSITPPDAKTAADYLEHLQPVLDFYGYTPTE